MLRGEAGVEEEDCVAPGETLPHQEEEGEGSLHRAYCRHYAARRYVDVKERLEKFGTGLLELRDSGDVGVHAGDPLP